MASGLFAMRVARIAHLLSFSLALLLFPVASRAADVPNVAAAADLQFALPEIAAAFTRDTGHAVKLVFGSSGNLRRQIGEGAPFQLFLSADEAYVQALAREGKTRDQGVIYAVGRVAVVAAEGSPLVPDAALANLRSAIAAGRVTRFAIANPEHAPYGRAAREALQKAGLWDVLQSKLVLGENVAQAAQFAITAGAQGGIVSYAQVVGPALRGKVRYAVLPDESHAPIRQRMALLRDAGVVAEAFFRYVSSPAGRGILTRYGFGVPLE
jgi:molybdate transport system substrate-binding protein